MPIRNPVLALLLTAAAGPGLAATLIEGKDEEGGNHRIMIDGDWARMEYGDGEPAEYLLLNLNNNQAYAVDREQKQIVDLSDSPDHPAPAETPHHPAKPAVTFKKQGAGPEIAGYPTEHYVLTAAGEACGERFVAPRTLASDDVQRFIQAMLLFSQGQAAGEEDPARDPCTAAEDVADTEYTRLGLPMRVTDNEGQVVHEITAVRTVDGFPAGSFALPADYTVTNPRKIMEQMMSDMPSPEAHSSMPMDEETRQKMREQMQRHLEEMQREAPAGAP